VRERGYTVQTTNTFWSTPELAEQTPELRWPLCLDVYEAMVRQDAQVSSVLRAVTAPILRTPWRIDGTGCDPKVTAHVAADLGLPVAGQGNEVPAVRTRDRFSWQRHLRLGLLMLRYGHAYFEQVYRLDADGLAHLRKLGYRPPKTIANFNVARDGGLTSIEQYAGSGSLGTVTLPITRLVAYVHEQEGGDWTGTSLLRPAYKNWLLKDRLLRVDTQSKDRNGMGVPVYKGAPGETDLSAGEDIATSVRSGDNSGAALPNGADLELLGVTGSLPDALASVRYHDEQIARAVLAHFLNLGQAVGTGSYALGDTLGEFFTQSLQSVAEEVRDVATMHVVEDLVDINYGPDEPAPRLVFDEIGARGDAVIGALASLVTAGVLRADESLEQFIRTTLGLPAYSGPLPASTQEAS
jgi:hypothetical protein